MSRMSAGFLTGGACPEQKPAHFDEPEKSKSLGEPGDEAKVACLFFMSVERYFQDKLLKTYF